MKNPLSTYTLPHDTLGGGDNKYLPSVRKLTPIQYVPSPPQNTLMFEIDNLMFVVMNSTLYIKRTDKWIEYELSDDFLGQSKFEYVVISILWSNGLHTSWDNGYNSMLCTLLHQPYAESFIQNTWKDIDTVDLSKNAVTRTILTPEVWLYMLRGIYMYCKNNETSKELRHNRWLKKFGIIVDSDDPIDTLVQFLVMTQRNRDQLIYNLFRNILYDDIMVYRLEHFFNSMTPDDYHEIYDDAFSTM